MDDYDIVGYPRLVRLNPNIPWKTRGNGALCIRVGKKTCKVKRKIGEIGGREVFATRDIPKDVDRRDVKRIKQIVKEVVEDQARVDDENTNPGFVLLKKQPRNDFYKQAVTQIISLSSVEDLLVKLGAEFEGYKNKRGLIGATAAIAWEPLDDHTYEIISYRQKPRWGTKRFVDPESVQHMDHSCPHTFDNYDYRHKHNRIVPSSPCPILYGIRGNDVDELQSAPSLISSEPVESWLVFESNQGTDDHLTKRHIALIQPYDSVVAEGFIVDAPRTIQGGHVFFSLKDSTGCVECAAYEPTKEFRNIVRALTPGDIVEVYGGVREQPLTINLEKIHIKHLATHMQKTENPVCPTCGKHMKSKGTNQGYECRICHTKNNDPLFNETPRSLHLGFYEVPVCARRHLSKPLKRLNIKPEEMIAVSES